MSSYNGFYGGRTGASYEIKQHFDSIKDMTTAFAQGGAYTEVGYGEYCIIDTIVNLNQKRNSQNGILYRRGYNYTEVIKDKSKVDFKAYKLAPGAGAEYIGDIVGPVGESAEVVGESWETFSKATKPADKKSGSYVYSTSKGVGIVSGQYQYHDKLRTGFYNIENENGEVTVHLAFDFPDEEFKFDAVVSNPIAGPKVVEVSKAEDFLTIDPDEYTYYHYTGEDIDGQEDIPDIVIGESVTYHLKKGSYYRYDKSAQIYLDTIDNGFTDIYIPVPDNHKILRYVAADPWSKTSDGNFKGLIREKAESIGHKNFNSYEITLPVLKKDVVIGNAVNGKPSEHDSLQVGGIWIVTEG